jgi:hypothetical protein
LLAHAGHCITFRIIREAPTFSIALSNCAHTQWLQNARRRAAGNCRARKKSEASLCHTESFYFSLRAAPVRIGHLAQDFQFSNARPHWHLQIAQEWAALARGDDIPDQLDPVLQQSINEVAPHKLQLCFNLKHMWKKYSLGSANVCLCTQKRQINIAWRDMHFVWPISVLAQDARLSCQGQAQMHAQDGLWI